MTPAFFAPRLGSILFAVSMLSAIAPAPAALPAEHYLRVKGAGLKRRQKFGTVKGRAAKGRWPGTAGKLRP